MTAANIVENMKITFNYISCKYFMFVWVNPKMRKTTFLLFSLTWIYHLQLKQLSVCATTVLKK